MLCAIGICYLPAILLPTCRWLGLVVNILVPPAFFILMCLPKHFIKPIPFPQQLFSAMDLDQPQWAREYRGEAPLQMRVPCWAAVMSCRVSIARHWAARVGLRQCHVLSQSVLAERTEPLPFGAWHSTTISTP